MSEIYFVGVDGGGSKTSYVLMDRCHRIVKRFQNGPSTYDVIPDDIFRQTISEGLSHVMPKEGDVVSAFLGIGGVSGKEDENKIVHMIKEGHLFQKGTMIRAGNDIYNAFYSTFTDSGICLIVGTGCVIYGKEPGGRELRLSGYGYLEGDKGSGYDISISALRILGKMFDGVLKFDDDFRCFASHIGVFEKTDLIHYLGSSTRSQIASNAKFLLRFDENEYIQQIMESGAKNFSIYVDALLRQLPQTERKMTIIGSCGLCPVYLEKILKKVHSLHPEIEFIPNLHEADYGAAYYASLLYERT